MYQRIVVPYDRSDRSWTAVQYAKLLADHWGATVEVLHVEEFADGVTMADISHAAERAGWLYGVEAALVAPEAGGVGETIVKHVAEQADPLVVMSTHGRGRSAALLGSVAEVVIRQMSGPVLLVGPAADPSAFTIQGPLIACVDGSTDSETVLPTVGTWAESLKVDPWVVLVTGTGHDTERDMLASGYTTRVAKRLRADGAAFEPQFEVLHDENPGAAAVEFAVRMGASMLGTATHARTGLARIRSGSVAMEIVHDSPVPVLTTLID